MIMPICWIRWNSCCQNFGRARIRIQLIWNPHTQLFFCHSHFVVTFRNVKCFCFHKDTKSPQIEATPKVKLDRWHLFFLCFSSITLFLPFSPRPYPLHMPSFFLLSFPLPSFPLFQKEMEASYFWLATRKYKLKKKTKLSGSSHRGSVVTNRTIIHEEMSSIPGLYHWVKDPALPWASV